MPDWSHRYILIDRFGGQHNIVPVGTKGYDGIEVIDRKEPEMVIFPKAIKKLL